MSGIMMWLLALTACGVFRPSCDEDTMAQVVKAVEQSGRNHELALEGFGEACPGVLGEGAKTVRMSSRETRTTSEIRAIRADNWALARACQQPLATLLPPMARMTEAEQRAYLWSGCHMAERGWMSEEEWMGSTGPFALPIAAGEVLTYDGVEPETVRFMVRAMSDIP